MQTERVDTPVGPLTIVAGRIGIEAIVWEGDLGRRVQISPQDGPASHRHVSDAIRQLGEYFAGDRTDFSVPLDPQGTPFQTAVWQTLSSIPYGTTTTYAEVAAAMGRPDAVRAVGAANGRNPISIMIPCHRVIGSGGALTGYAGGLIAKAWLLDHERATGRR